jgi:hypothetical protein
MAAKKKKSVKKVATKKADRTIRLALTESVVSQKYTDHEIREAVLKEFPDARLSVTDVRNARDQLNNGDRAKLGFPKPKKPYEKLYRVDKKLVPESQAPSELKQKRGTNKGIVRKMKTKETLAKYGLRAGSKAKKAKKVAPVESEVPAQVEPKAKP